MPYLRIDTNKRMISGDFTEKLHETSRFVAEMLGESEDWVMISVNPGLPMLYGGSREYMAFVELKSAGLAHDKCAAFHSALIEFIERIYGISKSRIYVEFRCLGEGNIG